MKNQPILRHPVSDNLVRMRITYKTSGGSVTPAIWIFTASGKEPSGAPTSQSHIPTVFTRSPACISPVPYLLG